MPCLTPKRGYQGRAAGGKWTGNEAYAAKDEAGNPIPLHVPCGDCQTCRQRKQRELAVQAFCETQFHARTCFVTVTYATEYLPRHGSLAKKATQQLLRDIRQRVSDFHWADDERVGLVVTEDDRKQLHPKAKAIRYLVSGEYGEQHQRPHEHMLLWGTDLREWGATQAIGNTASQLGWRSKLLADLLTRTDPITGQRTQRGSHLILPVNYSTAGYVAKYTTKDDDAREDLALARQFGVPAPHDQHRFREWPQDSDDFRPVTTLDVRRWSDSRVLEYFQKSIDLVEVKEPQFVLRSSRNGCIGHDYCRKYMNEIYRDDAITVLTDRGDFKCNPPQAFDDLCKKHEPELWEDVKRRRFQRWGDDPEGQLRRTDPVRLAQQERVVITRNRKKKRERIMRTPLDL